jgi:hypothetical protein
VQAVAAVPLHAVRAPAEAGRTEEVVKTIAEIVREHWSTLYERTRSDPNDCDLIAERWDGRDPLIAALEAHAAASGDWPRPGSHRARRGPSSTIVD